ncbi:MAG: OmpH family outer membrane protein [Saprospiraceae bacterium]|nr:OmpH family outer membrane protein [Saprospiraceae bacterium]
MKNLLTGAIVLLAFVLMSVNFGTTNEEQTAPKQVKFGHVDMTEVLKNMPQIKQANAKLEAQRTQSVKQLEGQYTKMQATYAKAMEDAQAGRLTEIQQQQIEADLTKMQQDYAANEKAMTENLVKKEKALFDPIQASIRTAIDQVAIEKGYRFIFDSSKGGMVLYGRKADDVMKYVKPKLGIK